MKILKTLFGCFAGATLAMNVNAQEVQGFVHERSTDYEWPTDKQVLEKLDKWQDQKFGVLFHWGLYSVPGIVESWSICSEDVDWISRKKDMTYDEYKKWYYGLKDSLNPTQFNPDQWADIMKDAGMKYMIFTTKHHDGFCMFDSKYTDFSIANGPFAGNPKKDVARYVFDAFRQKDFMIGCYFSKPDWHCEWYWNPYFATPNRRQNYKKENHPDWWKNYQEFTYNQMEELMTNYGSFDIFWLDGGWVTGGDVNLDKLLTKVRTSTQPGLISVDRTIRGKNENYQTPERSIPEKQLNNPWESCITLSNDWGWVPNAPYKSPTKVIGLLAEITAKGGCLLLGVGPTPQGIIEDAAAERLHTIGEWLRANGKAIYNTRITPVYNDGNVWFTADKDGKTLYAIYALPDGENLPATIEWTGNTPKGKMKMLKGNKTVKYTSKNGKVTVTLPKGLKNEPVALQFTVD
ncbi:alpha-L-fucosidase [Parabacteroides sp.]